MLKLSDFISSTYPFHKNPEIYYTKRINSVIEQFDLLGAVTELDNETVKEYPQYETDS